MERKYNWKSYLYLAPALILISIFTIYPLINTVLTAFKIDYQFMTGNFSHLGLKHFQDVIKSARFKTAFKNTMIMTFISVPLSVSIALLIAVGLNSIKRLQPVYQTIFFLPYVTNVIAIGLVFQFMFNYDFGLVNTALGWFGIGPVTWMNAYASYWEAMSVIMIYTIWGSLPFKIMVFLSGLQSIDKQYYQAAQIDATPKWRVFFRITVPLLSPMIMYITITSFMGAFKAYDTVLALFPSGGTAGDPGNLKTMVWYIYEALDSSKPGSVAVASAASIILFGVILIFTAVQMYINKKRVHY